MTADSPNRTKGFVSCYTGQIHVQGEWRIVPMSGKRSETGVVTQRQAVTNIAYTTVVVKGDTMILSGGNGANGRPLPVQEQTLEFNRSADGTLYRRRKIFSK